MRIRFSFNQQNKTGVEQATRSTAATIVEELTFNAAEEDFKAVKEVIAKSFRTDAQRELGWMATLFRRHITGAPGSGKGPKGDFTYAISDDGDAPFSNDDAYFGIGDSLPENGWADRTESYLRYKKKRGWSQAWFKASGSLQPSINADFFSSSFGGIRITIKRNLKAKPSLQGRRLRTNFVSAHDRIHLNIATIRVFALEKVTPGMLPALASGRPDTTNNGDGRTNGLLSLVAAGGNEEAALKLGGRRSTPYRPTLEPFLAFYLTRSIPHAVGTRINEGLKAARSSAGRTRR